jgi:hypothetical protein
MGGNNARHATGATNSTNRIASGQILIVSSLFNAPAKPS